MTSVPYIPSYESGGTATSGEVPESYLNSRYSIWSWIFTKDHKRICILYMLSITFFFLIGGAAATIMRIELMSPHGWLMSDDVYNKMFTTHGVMMVFFFLIPSIPATLGNFLIPLMIGAKDLAFPKVNLLSWYLYMSGGTLAFIALVAGGIDTGWTFYTPYSTTYADGWVTLTLFGIFLNGFSSILTGLNFLVSIHKMRAPGMTWFRLPLFIWSMYATSVIFILGTPVVAIALSLVIFERVFGLGIFDPALGGDPVLFQHMFWFYSHPAVYIMILPSMGVVSEIIACFSRKKVFGYEMVAFSSLAIAIIGFLVWGHHMFLTSQSVYSGLVFSILSFLVGIPSAIKVFNWTTTMYKGSVDLKTPMLYALGFVGLFTLGGLTGLFLACMGMDIHLHDTYFIIAHFHYIMVGGALMGYMGGLHFWWPKITGRLYNEWLGRCAAITLFIGFNVTFFPQFILGYLGMPRRYHTYPEEFQMLNVLSTAGASVMAIGYILPLFYLLYSLKYGKAAGPNPYTASGLEWTTQSPPLTENFLETPIVTQEAYAYAEMEIKVSELYDSNILTSGKGAHGDDTGPLTAGTHVVAEHRHGDAEGHDGLVVHHFVDLDQQRESATLGMWIFLATEVMFIGAIFVAYFTYRLQKEYFTAFRWSSENLIMWVGFVNTLVLLTSSLTVVLAIRAAQQGRKAAILRQLIYTFVLGCAFFGFKVYEYTTDYKEHLWPGAGVFSGTSSAETYPDWTPEREKSGLHYFLPEKRFVQEFFPAGLINEPNGSGGSGYTKAPLVSVTGGSGRGVTATANVNNGAVTGVTITNSGDGYLPGDSLNFAFSSEGATTPATELRYVVGSANSDGTEISFDDAKARFTPAQLDVLRIKLDHSKLFYRFYYGLTGLHAFHMLVGLGIFLFLIFKAYLGKFTPEDHVQVEICGLYWHFVDIVWIFLFPLLYLVR